MKHIRPQRCFLQLASVAFLILTANGANAQTPEIRYRLIGGQVYAYDPTNPGETYLMSDLTPGQGLLYGGAPNNKERASGARNEGNIFPYNANQRTPLPARASASNSALPEITFRESLLRQTDTLRIDGLPRYPGKKY